MTEWNVAVVGGGAAGFFAAITCAEAQPGITVVLLEKGPRFLSKVRISGGGRCNVTHACFDATTLSGYYPRGARELLGPFQRFQASDTVDWFERRGVKLKTEADGRMFPVTDSSQTVIDCLERAARDAGVELVSNHSIERVTRVVDGGFELESARGEVLRCRGLMLATGGCRVAAGGKLAVSLGHTLEPPVPSLFTFHVAAPWVRELAGVSAPDVEASVPEFGLKESGPMLITHSGLSGPAILRLSAWGARRINEVNYRFPLLLNWVPHLDSTQIYRELECRRKEHAARLVVNSPIPPLASRLWEKLVLSADVSRETRWAELSSAARHRITQQLIRMQLEVEGKTLNQEEFVTCGGVRLSEVNFKTMESRICPGLHFGGELLDIDAVTGGFNFQSAWTTGWLAGKAMASVAR